MIAINAGGIVFDYDTTTARIQYASGIGKISRSEVYKPSVARLVEVQIPEFPIHNLVARSGYQESCYIVSDIFVTTASLSTNNISIYRQGVRYTLFSLSQVADARTLAFRHIWGPLTVATYNSSTTFANDGSDFTMGMYITHSGDAAKDYLITVVSYDIAVGPYNSLSN